MKNKILFAVIMIFSLIQLKKSYAQPPLPWVITGNGNTIATSFIGHSNALPLNLKTMLAQPINFFTGNSQKATILANGNVGIGTTTPTEKLDVAGNIKVNLNQIYFKDQNHGLAYFITYASKVIDGPVLYGYSGGALGTSQAGTKNIALYWNASGNVGIGTTLTGSTYDPSYKLAVKGNIRANKVVVDIGWADFVFEKNYKLKSLQEVEQYLIKNRHLPEIPSAIQVETNGADVGELLKLQMQKIEELTLYLIQLDNKVNKLQSENEELKKVLKNN